MDNPIPMTRAELDEWAHLKLGAKWTRPWGADYAYLSYQKEFEQFEQFPLGCRDVTLKALKDPTTDLSAAWKLKEWLMGCDAEYRVDMFSPQQRFVGEWRVTRFWEMDEPAAALWICCTVYWAVEGKRVQIVGGEGDG